MMKKFLSLALAVMMIWTAALAMADGDGNPPEIPTGGMGGTPPDGQGGPGGTPPDGQGGPGGTPPDGQGGPGGTPPDGNGGPGGTPPDGKGGPGGMSSGVDSYDAVLTFTEDAEISGQTVASEGADENAVLVQGGAVTVDGSTVSRDSDSSSGGDQASFYGVGAAVLVTDGTVTVTDSTITTDASGGAGVFAYGSGTAYVSDTTITTQQGASGGIHVAGGGRLKAVNLTVETNGGSSAAIRSDRGSGTMTVSGGTYTANGSGSPAVYVTADITIENAELTATGSEALCLEGLNAVRLYNCSLTGMMPDQEQNDNTWTVILYQSMSGDSQVGEGSFVMDGGSLTSTNGGLFYTTNTDSVFVIRNVDITAAEDCEYFLRVTGNSNKRGWGKTGANGANCVFTAIDQEMNGDIVYDSISNLTLYLTEGTILTGAVIDDESCAGEGGSGTAAVVIDAASAWIVTGDSTVTSLQNAGVITDAEGLTVTVMGTDGTVYVQGDSAYTVTVSAYSTEVDVSGAGTVGSFAEYDIL